MEILTKEYTQFMFLGPGHDANLTKPAITPSLRLIPTVLSDGTPDLRRMDPGSAHRPPSAYDFD